MSDTAIDRRTAPTASGPHYVHDAGDHPSDILRFAARLRDAGEPAAFATLTGVVGASSRRLGAQMAIARNGAYAGSVAGGCFDAAIVGFAFEAIAAGRGRRVRLGEGGPFLDLVLPCGGGVDLLMTPNPDGAALKETLAALDRRTKAALRFDEQNASLAADIDAEAADATIVEYRPKLRLVIAGRGAELAAATRLSVAAGYVVEVYSTQTDDLEHATRLGARAHALPHLGAVPQIVGDPWTAVLLLFHDHEWEPAILKAALSTTAFYVGAMGSRRAHAARLAALRDGGVAEAELSRVRGPIGVVPATRDPSMLSLSALTEVAAAYDALGA